MTRNPAAGCGSIGDIAARAAPRLILTLGRDGKWRGRCAACDYAKPRWKPLWRMTALQFPTSHGARGVRRSG